jgi:DNA-binding PadR family transcriptional regulator
MSREPRLTGPTLKVLGALSSSADELSGAQIARVTNLPSGTLYPILFRLERAGWLQSRWEAGDPRLLNRPRRRFYRVTAVGARNAQAAVMDLTAAWRVTWA